MKMRMGFVGLLGALILTACQQDVNVEPATGHLVFSLSKKLRTGGRAQEKAEPAFVLLSIEDAGGKEVVDAKLALYQFGQNYVTENIDLITGSYKLTQFKVLDNTNSIIYATPLEGSPLAKYVDDSLPIDFVVVKDEETHLVPQVLAITPTDAPESFGYASFSFNVVAAKKLSSRERFSFDVATKEFVPEFKFFYSYDKAGKIARIDARDFNPKFNAYGTPYQLYQYDYDSDGKLLKRIRFMEQSSPGYRQVEEYMYIDAKTTKVFTYSVNGTTQSQKDWVLITKTPTGIQAKYYQYDSFMYGQLEATFNEKGNIVTMGGYGSMGTIHLNYDNAPNPEYYPYVLEQPFFQNTYSRNNVVNENTSFEYDADGYPTERIQVYPPDPSFSSRIVYKY